MKKFLLLVAAAVFALTSAAAPAPGDIKISYKASNNVSWVDAIFAKQSNALLGTDSNGVPGVATAASLSGPLTINKASEAYPTPTNSTVLHVLGPDSTTSRVLIDAFTATPVLSTRAARGTSAAPTHILSGDSLGTWSGFGRGTTGYQESGTAAISYLATEDFTDTAMGSKIRFEVTANGSLGRSTALDLEQDKSAIFYGALRLQGATYYSSFSPGAQAANITYTLPTAIGAAGTVLTDAAGNGVLSWAAGGGGGGGNVSNSGTPTSGQIAKWVTATTIQGVDASTLSDSVLGLSGNGFVKRTGSNTYTNDTNTYLTANQTISFSPTGDVSSSGGSGATNLTPALTVTKINGTSLSGLGTGILKNTTGTGVPSIAVAGDFPTLNQNTSGSAATLTTGRTIGMTGDVTWTSASFNGSGNVTGTSTLGNIPTGTTMAGSILATNIAAPSSPAAGKVSIFTDSTDLRFHDKNSAGTVGTTVVADTGASNNFLTAISAAGVISKAQPSFSNLSGNIATSQMNSGTSASSSTYWRGDGTWATPGGSGTVTVVASGSLTSTALVTGGGTTTVQTPNNSAQLDSSGNISTPGSITTGVGGSVAGTLELTQGTAPSAGTTSVKLYAPSSVTSYVVALPGAAASGVPVWSNSAGVVTESIVAPSTSGNVLTSNGTTWVSSAATGGTFANPTASVGLSAVNGSASTYMRSDAAPALSVTIAPTWTGVHTFSPGARSSGVAPYFTLTTPADTGQTAATEAIGVDFTTATRTWATTGTVANQREIFFRGKTYASASASQTFTDISTLAITPPIAGTNAIFTRGHSLQIVDATSAASSITGGLVVAAALGTTATSTGIGNGNINTGGKITAGGAGSFGATTVAGAAGTTALTVTQTARTSGVLPYIKWTIPTDTGQTASTESPGIQGVTGTRTWATTGTVALQREIFFPGPTYASASASQTFTDVFNMYLTPPVAGTNAIFTRGHTLGIVDSTSAASSITGGLVVATTLGTSATSVGIGGGNINAGGTITAGGAISNGTSNSLSTGTIELGAASDTTIARVSAGQISVEGVTVDTISGTNTLTNKRITPRIASIGSGATPTVNTDNYDCVNITGLAVDITSMTTNLSGTPTDFQQLEYRITGTAARAITWGASFVAGPTALPTTTTTTKALHVYFEWDSVQSKWVCLSSGSDA